MNRTQFWILNVVGVACAGLVLGTACLNRENERRVRDLETDQAQLNRIQQVQTFGQNFVTRLRQVAAEEPALSELLARHEIGGKSAGKPAPTP